MRKIHLKLAITSKDYLGKHKTKILDRKFYSGDSKIAVYFKSAILDNLKN